MAQGTTKGVPIDIDGTLSNNSDLLVASQKATKTYVDNGLSLKQNTIGYTPVNKGGDTMIGNLILNANPTSALGAATKDYVDTLINGIDWKQSANAATVAALPAYTVTGSGQILTGTVNGAIPSATTDGVTLIAGNRLLVKNETSTLTPNNGIYVVTQDGSGSTPFILTRSSDANTSALLSEATLSVSAGSTLSNTQWHCNPASTTIIIGTTYITFANIGGGVYAAGSGLTLVGNIFSIATNGVTDAMIQSATNWNTAYTNRITSATAPLSISSNTISITQATNSVDGYLSSIDWNTFNNKYSLPSLTSGSVLFSNGTTIAQDNANFFWDDSNNRLGIGTNSPSAILHSVGSVTASSGFARGHYFQPTLVAAANSDTLVGLEIIPTFTLGAFTGLSYYGLRIRQGAFAGNNGSQIAIMPTDANGAIIGSQGGSWNALGIWGAGRWTTGATPDFRVFGTGVVNINTKLLINTTTDAGYLLDVNGTARVSGVFLETITANRQTASYTLVLADRGKLIEMNVATANNLTIPLNSSVAFPVGTKIDVAQYGAGQITFVATGGVTIRSTNGWLKMNAQYGSATLVKIATDEWYLFGNLNA